MASPRHSKNVAAAHGFDGGSAKYKSGNNLMRVGKDDARRDGAHHQHHLALGVGDRAAVLQPSCRAFRCTACGGQFSSRKYLSMHMALHKMAAEAPPPLPPACTSKRHARSGSAAEQWSCPVCGKTFAQNSHFRNHARTHSDQRPYVCLVCLIGFKERYHLKKHMLFKHSPDQLNEACRQCGKRFKDLTAVRAHERTHSDARPYACCRCEKTFKTSECLWHHRNRSKTCGRAASSGHRSQSLHCDEISCTPAIGHTSSGRRQRRSRAPPSPTTFDSPASTTEAAAVVATPSTTHFVESSSIEASTTSPSNASFCAPEAGADAMSGGVKPETEMADLFECALWTTSDGAASQSRYIDVDINFCTAASCFDDVIVATTADAAVNASIGDTAEVTAGCCDQFWNGAAAVSSHDERRLQSSFVAASDDAAFQIVSGYSERRPQLRYQTTSGCCTHHSNCAYDAIDASYDSRRSSKQLPADSKALVESVGSSDAFSGSYLPPAVVTPRKRDRRRSTTSSPRQHAISQPPTKTFHLPPIETFAPPRRRPRRPVLSTWS